MAARRTGSSLKPNRLEWAGYAIILAFILYSTVYVNLRHGPRLDPDVKQITLAHWLGEREKLEERLRLVDWILPGTPEPKPPRA